MTWCILYSWVASCNCFLFPEKVLVFPFQYYYFIRLMGRKASHVALECTLQSHPNMVSISYVFFLTCNIQYEDPPTFFSHFPTPIVLSRWFSVRKLLLQSLLSLTLQSRYVMQSKPELSKVLVSICYWLLLFISCWFLWSKSLFSFN